MEAIYTWLNQNSIIYTRHDHDAVFTVEEADAHTGRIEGVSAKTLLVFGEKTKQFYLISLEGHKKLEQPRIKALVGERVRFADATDLQRMLNVTPGSVSPLGLMFDTHIEISVYVVDQEILDADIVTWHPNNNTQTLEFTQENNQKILDTLPHKKMTY